MVKIQLKYLDINLLIKYLKKVIENSKLQARGKLDFREIIGIYSPVYVEQKNSICVKYCKSGI